MPNFPSENEDFDFFALFSPNELRCWWTVLFNVKKNNYFIFYFPIKISLQAWMLKNVNNIKRCMPVAGFREPLDRTAKLCFGLWLYCLQGSQSSPPRQLYASLYASKCTHSYSPKHGQRSKFKPISFLTNTAKYWHKHLCHWKEMGNRKGWLTLQVLGG